MIHQGKLPVNLKQMSTKRLSVHLLQLVLFYLLIFFKLLDSATSANGVLSSSPEEEEEIEAAIGYGYSIQSVIGDSSGKTLTAHLQLIQNSSILGLDIQFLTLTAR